MKPVKLLMVGWDGAEPGLVEPWLAAGQMPVLAELVRRGAAGRIRSTIPAVTPPAWTSAVTGVDPGRHGIYSFTRPGDGVYGEQLVTAAERQYDSVWQRLSAAGRTVGVFNLSLSYPPEPVNGFLLAGFDSPVFAPSILYPQEAFAGVTAGLSGYVHSGLGEMQGEMVVRALTRQGDQQRDLLAALTERYPVEILAANFNLPDHVHHHAWPLSSSIEEVAAEREGTVARVYRHLDGLLGDLLERYTDEETNIVLFSDHGGGGMRGSLSLAQALEEGGVIKRRSAQRQTGVNRLRRLGGRVLPRAWKSRLWAAAGSQRREQAVRMLHAAWVANVDWGQTKVFPWGSSGFVQVNQRGRQPEGSVAPEDAGRVLEEVAAYLSEISDPQTGEAVVGAIYRGEELFRAPRVGYAPDLLVEGRDHQYAVLPIWAGWGSEAPQGLRLVRPGERDPRGVTASHRPHGILVTAGPAVRPGAEVPDLGMVDIGATLLYLAGEPLPEDLDGQVARNLWDTGKDPETQEPASASGAAAGAGAVPYTSEEQDAVEARLRDLGYM